MRASYADTSARDAARGVATVEFVSSQSPFKKADITSDEGRGRVQARVDSLAQVFVEAVADNRGVTVDRVLDAFGKGYVLIGQAAVAAGMADAIGTFEGTLAALAADKVPSRPPAMPHSAVSSKPSCNAPAMTVADGGSTTVIAERVRVQRIIAMTPKGAEDECCDAIRSGMPVEAFSGVLAARTILEAGRLARGV